MLSRRASNPNDLGLVIGVTITLLTIVILFGLLVLWRWKIYRAHKASRSKPPHRLALPLHKARFDLPSAPNSASSYASTFKFPTKNHGALTDLKDPFHFPTPLPTPPPQAVVAAAYRAYAAPPPRTVEMDPIALQSSAMHGSFDKHHQLEDGVLQPFRGDTGDENHSDGWKTSYYENNLSASRPPSYGRPLSRTRSHSPLPVPVRSSSLKVLARKPSSAALARPLSQPLDVAISTDVHVHVDSLYVEAHGEDEDEAATTKGQRVRIMSVAPQIPSIYLPSMHLGVPFEAFGTLADGEADSMKPVEEERKGASEEGMREFVFPKRVSALPVAPKASIATSPSVQPLERTTTTVKNSRVPPSGWI